MQRLREIDTWPRNFTSFRTNSVAVKLRNSEMRSPIIVIWPRCWSLGTMHRFQVIIRLQMVRVLVAEALDQRAFRRNRLQGIVAIRSVGEAAAEQHFWGYAVACGKVTERLNRFVELGNCPPSLLVRVSDWAAISELHIRRPNCPWFGGVLQMQLDESFSG